MGRALEIVNIPLKPTPKGFKIWVLANQGYVFNQLQHAKGNNKGLVDLDTVFLKEGFSKTQAVVLDFLTQINPLINNERLYLPGKHVIQLNNLFYSVKLFKQFFTFSIRAAGTVRTTQIKREKMGDRECDIVISIETSI